MNMKLAVLPSAIKYQLLPLSLEPRQQYGEFEILRMVQFNTVVCRRYLDNSIFSLGKCYIIHLYK
jgi:hypothetical protein